MRYRNIKTGQIIDVPSSVSGKNWERVNDKAPEKEPVVSAPIAEEEEVKPAKKTTRTKKTKK